MWINVILSIFFLAYGLVLPILKILKGKDGGAVMGWASVTFDILVI